MNYSISTINNRLVTGSGRSLRQLKNFGGLMPRLWLLVVTVLSLQVFAYGVIVHPEISVSDDQTTVIVNDAPEQDVIVFGKSVLVQKRAKGVLAVGGDIVVEGRVEGDVATVGGNVIQKENAYIGGDIIVFGGSYKPESDAPLRAPGKETVMFGVFEDELRSMGQNPSQILAPTFTLGFLAQRLIIALFWFIISLAFTTLAPGAIGRSVARLQLSTLKVVAVGAATFLFISAIIIAGTVALPNYLSATLAVMGIVLLMLGFVFGRVVLQVSAGKLIQKHFLAGNNRSETLAILLGVLAWTLLLSLPYVWVIALFVVFAAGVGLVVTGRPAHR